MEGKDDVHLSEPAIAIDNNGNGILVFTKRVTTRDNTGCFSSADRTVEYMKFQGSDKEFLLGGVLDNVPPNPPGISVPTRLEPEIAFNSNLLSPGLITRQQGVAAWWDFTVHSVDCGSFERMLPSFWPKYAVWNGNDFEQIDFIPERLMPPSDLTDNISISTQGISISSDQFGHAKAVWVIERVFGDPCSFPSQELETWSAIWNGSDWELKAAKFNSLGEVNPTEGFQIGIDLAYLPNNEAIAVYNDIVSSGDNKILWSLEGTDTTWSNNGQANSGNGFEPAIASLAHDQTVAIWSDEGNIMWSNITNNMLNTGWMVAQVLAEGEEPDIAAHTGSPTLPHAEWTYSAYLAGDNSLRTEILEDGEEMLSIGSTNLVDVVTLTDKGFFGEPFPDGITRYEYIKFDSSTTVVKTCCNLVTSAPQNLEDFLAFVVEAYPANRFALDFLNHGYGWPGDCQDDTLGSQDGRMDWKEKKQALTNTGKKFNLLIFSECFMAQLEVAYQYRTFGDLMVASQWLMPGPGQNYNKVLNDLT